MRFFLIAITLINIIFAQKDYIQIFKDDYLTVINHYEYEQYVLKIHNDTLLDLEVKKSFFVQKENSYFDKRTLDTWLNIDTCLIKNSYSIKNLKSYVKINNSEIYIGISSNDFTISMTFFYDSISRNNNKLCKLNYFNTIDSIRSVFFSRWSNYYFPPFINLGVNQKWDVLYFGGYEQEESVYLDGTILSLKNGKAIDSIRINSGIFENKIKKKDINRILNDYEMISDELFSSELTYSGISYIGNKWLLKRLKKHFCSDFVLNNQINKSVSCKDEYKRRKFKIVKYLKLKQKNSSNSFN